MMLLILDENMLIHLAISEFGSNGMLLSMTVTDWWYTFRSISSGGSPDCSRIDLDTKTLIMMKLIGMIFCSKNKIQLRVEYKYFFLNMAIHWLIIRLGPLINSML